MGNLSLGPVVYSFFVDHLQATRGLRPGSIRSYRDGLRLFLNFVASDSGHRLTHLSLEELTFERVLSFLTHLESERHNHIRTRNQRLAILHTFFEYAASRLPELLKVAERIAAIPAKRVAPPETQYLTREEVQALLSDSSLQGSQALRDRTLLLFLYNSGARVQEAADLHVGDLELGEHPRVRLHGKGDKWRTCPLWAETSHQLQLLLEQDRSFHDPKSPVFRSRSGVGMTRFGLYKIVRRHASNLEHQKPLLGKHRVTPHVFRHTTAVHLLEAGVEVNVIRSWLGHVSLDTTNRYAELTIQAKEAALRACEPPQISGTFPQRPVWRNDESLLAWLDSL